MKQDNLQEIIKALKNCDLNNVSYNKVCNILLNSIKELPLVKNYYLNKGARIYRARINENEIFYSENDISYNSNIESIKKYGRFNTPYQSLFYGSLFGDFTIAEINNEYEVPEENSWCIPLFELSDIFNKNTKDKIQLATIGQWEVKDRMPIYYCDFENQKNYNNVDIKEVVNFYYENFRKKVTNHNDYKISAAYFNLLMSYCDPLNEDCQYHGLVYRACLDGLNGFCDNTNESHKLKANNITLLPVSVDKYLELKKVFLVMLVKSNINVELIPIMHATDFGNCNSDFKWFYDSDFIKNNKINKIEIKKSTI